MRWAYEKLTYGGENNVNNIYIEWPGKNSWNGKLNSL